MTGNTTLTIATRESPLALWQAQFIQSSLARLHPGLAVQLLGMTTRGDQILDSPLAKVGGKGLFVKELETALLDGRADLAVHSTKDMPVQLPEGLQLQIVGRRETPNDALVLPAGESGSVASLGELPAGAVVGTSSLRRQCQLRQIRPDLQYADLRGNVNTRLAKLDRGDYAAIVLAAAGLQRLDLAGRISALLPIDELLPAVGQGALAIEYRVGDTQVARLVESLIHRETVLCVAAERAMNERLDGGCQVPIAGYAHLEDGRIIMQGRVGAVDGSQLLRSIDSENIAASDALSDATSRAASLGTRVAEQLLQSGAARLLAQLPE